MNYDRKCSADARLTVPHVPLRQKLVQVCGCERSQNLTFIEDRDETLPVFRA